MKIKPDLLLLIIISFFGVFLVLLYLNDLLLSKYLILEREHILHIQNDINPDILASELSQLQKKVNSLENQNEELKTRSLPDLNDIKNLSVKYHITIQQVESIKTENEKNPEYVISFLGTFYNLANFVNSLENEYVVRYNALEIKNVNINDNDLQLKIYLKVLK